MKDKIKGWVESCPQSCIFLDSDDNVTSEKFESFNDRVKHLQSIRHLYAENPLYVIMDINDLVKLKLEK